MKKRELFEIVLLNYEITKDGQVINKKTGRVLKHLNNRGYHTVAFTFPKIALKFQLKSAQTGSLRLSWKSKKSQSDRESHRR